MITSECNCHFIRVDKNDFNRILVDVESSTIRLKEHGLDTLVLEKFSYDTRKDSYNETESIAPLAQPVYRYSVVLGTPDRIFEYLIENIRITGQENNNDTFVEDFIATHIIFLPVERIIKLISSHLEIANNCELEENDTETSVRIKQKLVAFINAWSTFGTDEFYDNTQILQLVQDMRVVLENECKKSNELIQELAIIKIIEAKNPNPKARIDNKFKFMLRCESKDSDDVQRKPMKSSDEYIFRVFQADHTYTTLKLNMDTPSSQILKSACDKLGIKNRDTMVLCEVKSNGEKVVFGDNVLNVPTSLSLNGRLFLVNSDDLETLTPALEQEGPLIGTSQALELFEAQEIAYIITLHDWKLFKAVNPNELIYQVFGRQNFNKITVNSDLLMRRFNEIQFWISTEICLCSNLAKRVALIKKFIKLAAHFKDYQNLYSFFAVVMGLSNAAVSRLTLTWEKLQGKFRKMYDEFESMMDPSRNHRIYRMTVEQMEPPIIPFMPLLLKDMTFIHEGNRTFSEGLLNFEKMRLLANTIRFLKRCKSKNLDIPLPPNMKSYAEIKGYVKNLKVIDDQKRLLHLSLQLEPRKS